MAMVRALSVVTFSFIAVGTLASEPLKLDPITSHTSAKWQSDHFEFTLWAPCTVDFDGPFASRHCNGAHLYVSSTLKFDDQRSESVSRNTHGERQITSSDIAFSVQGKTVYDWSSSGTRFGRFVGSATELVQNLRRDPDSTVTLRYPVGTIRDLPPLVMPWDDDKKRALANSRTSHRNVYESRSFQLTGFSKVASAIEKAAWEESQKEMILINVMSSIVYLVVAVLIILVLRFIASKARVATQKSAAKLAEKMTERRIQKEATALHIREEAYRRFEAEKIKRLIQEALEEDDRQRAQELMAELERGQSD